MVEVTEVTIESIRVSLMNYNRVVVLRESDSNRYLPIYIARPRPTPSPCACRASRWRGR